ncbi:hypothetical protein [Bacillus cereus]|uniref:hypothetical protein n=1 Tax=Bacillus cereus TaxID=1396 RepID=UPI00124CEDAC|nr:hypothetical protein [Bacillus cereus]KAB2481416.1 hypothetical protein F8159_08505 [Bacillus cereus]
MEKLNFSYKINGMIIILFAMLSGAASIGISIFSQSQIIDIHLKRFNQLDYFLFIITSIILVIFIIEKCTSFVFNRNILMYIVIPLPAILGSLYSVCFIFDQMGYLHREIFPLNNDASFTSLFFFAIYSLMYNGFIIDWWDNIEIKSFKWIMLIFIETPNFISWWVLAFIAPLNFIKENSHGHFWMTFFFALSVILFLAGIRLIKNNSY